MIKRLRLANLLLLMSFVGLLMPQPARAANTDKLKRHPNHIPGQYIVVWKEMPYGTARDGSNGAGLNMSSISLSGDDADGKLTELLEDPHVEYVEENIPIHVFSSCTTYNTPTETWGLDRIDQPYLPLDKKYGLNETNTSGQEMMVYVIDTGMDINHYEFGGRAAWGTNTIDNIDRDCNGHGTATGGIVGGLNVGVAKNVKLMSVKVLACDGHGDLKSIIRGIDWVISHHYYRGGKGVAKSVASVSIGGGHSQAMNDAVNRASDMGVIFVVAAGNADISAALISPASAREAITVGSVGPDDVKASHSNHGPDVDIFAPGVRIKSSWVEQPTQSNGARSKRSYETQSHPGGFEFHRLSRSTRSTHGRIRSFCTRRTCAVREPSTPGHTPQTTRRTTSTTTRATTSWAFPTPPPPVTTRVPRQNPVPDTADPTFSETDPYAVLSGTSLACPHVSGVVALMLMKLPRGQPVPTVAQVRAYIIQRSVIAVRNVPADTTRALLFQPKCS